MKKVLCNMNHYYDADKFSTCPHCARAKAFLERSAPAAQRSEPPAQGAPARDGYWSLDDLRGKTSLPDTPAPGFSAPLPQEPSGLNIMHTTPAVPAGRDAAAGSACAGPAALSELRCAIAQTAAVLPVLRCADGRTGSACARTRTGAAAALSELRCAIAQTAAVLPVLRRADRRSGPACACAGAAA